MVLKHELRQLRKTDVDLVTIIVEYLFSSGSVEVNELTTFLEKELN